MIKNKKQLESFRYFTISHPVTDVSVYYSSRDGSTRIHSIVLGSATREKKSGRENPDPAIRDRIKQFLDGKESDLGSLPIDLSGFSPFTRKVLLAARSIPRGQVISYATLAQIAGNPRAVRAAASVMKKNPLPLIIPCHRVIRSDGSIGGYMGKLAGKEIELKKMLLRQEYRKENVRLKAPR